MAAQRVPDLTELLTTVCAALDEDEAALLAALRERSRLLERLTRIQRSISHRDPPQEVFDAITAGAAELLAVELVGLRLVDAEDQDTLVLISSHAMPERIAKAISRTPAGQGAGGMAFRQGRLVVLEGYDRGENVHPVLAADGLQVAMAAPVHERGRPVGVLTVASYAPDRHFSRPEQEALLAFAELREAQHARDLFFAMISHELKTPLTVIMGALRTLERPGVSEDVRRDLLRAAFERGRELERLIDRLLQGARAELASQPEVVDLPDLVAGALAGFDSSLPLVRGPVPEVAVELDANAVRTVLGILLENAATHAPPGTEVGVDTELADAEVQLAVHSSGSLPPDLGARELFEPFRRGGEASSAGVGLGLSIAWRVAASAGGRVDAASRDGRVVFTLRLPYRTADGRS